MKQLAKRTLACSLYGTFTLKSKRGEELLLIYLAIPTKCCLIMMETGVINYDSQKRLKDRLMLVKISKSNMEKYCALQFV